MTVSVFRLHYNRSTEVFSIRRSSDRSTVWASLRKASVPRVGVIVTLAPKVHILATRKDMLEAQTKSHPVLTVAVTRFPKLRLFFKYFKEVWL